MVGNLWFDRETGFTIYNVEDPNYTLLTKGAISMAGHSGTAYWFSKASGEFVTSTYYLDQCPDWVNALKAR